MKRGAPAAKKIKVSPRSFLAPALALQVPSLLRELLLDFEVTLTQEVRAHIAHDWHPKRKGKRGRPPLPAILALSESLAVARFYIWAAYARRKPDDMRGVPKAACATLQQFHCSMRTWEKHKAVALDYRKGTWWPAACRLARKNKREKLNGFV
jgi:hypothetical protein